MGGFARRGTLVVVAIAGAGVALHAGGWIGERAGPGVVQAASPDELGGTRTVTVVGVGDVTTIPTTAGVQLGVSVQRPTVRAAYDRAGAEMSALIAAVKSQGVAAADIQTTGLQVSSNSYPPGAAPGYVVSSTAQVTIRHLEHAEAVIAAATDAAGNDASVQGLGFGDASDPSLEAAARKAAMAAARDQAEQWAKLAGRHLGDVVSVTEAGATSPSCSGCGGSGGAVAGTGTATGIPLAPGITHVTEQVTVVFALSD